MMLLRAAPVTRCLLQSQQTARHALLVSYPVCPTLARYRALSLSTQPATSSSSPLPRPSSQSRTSSLQSPPPPPPLSSSDEPAAASYPPLDFDDVSQSFKSKTDAELLRALLVFRVCTIRPIVRHADSLLSLSQSVLGRRLTHAMLKRTFFAQFVAGETAEEVQPVVDRMRAAGVGAILDYAAEADVGGEHGGTGHGAGKQTAEEEQRRVHEANTELFAASIRTAGEREDGFAAIKLTAMGSPDLLITVTDFMLAVKRLFHAALTGSQLNNKEIPHLSAEAEISLQQLVAALRASGMTISNEEGRRLFEQIAAAKPSSSSSSRPTVSFLQFSDYFSPLSSHTLPVLPALSAASRSAFSALADRALSLASLTRQRRVCLLVDAEQTYLQPAIDCLALLMQREANRQSAFVFNTYQCYLRDTQSRLLMDVRRSEEEGWTMAAKTVRGAYMWQERQRAKELGYADRVQPDFAATTASYHSCVDFLLRRCPSAAHLVVAGHNEQTVRWVTGRMQQLGLQRSGASVFFGQLLGMCDHVSYSLAASGYRVLKVAPYGPLEEVLPYLIRRAQENADVLDRANKERRLVWREIIRRRLPALASRTAARHSADSRLPSSELKA